MIDEKCDTESAQKSVDNNLADIIGLTSQQQEPSPEIKSTANQIIQDSGNCSGDLASNLGLRPSAKFINEDKRHSNSYTSTSPQSTLRHKLQARTHYVNECYKNGKPVLWMLFPEKYPDVTQSFRSMLNKISAFNENDKCKIFLMTGAHEKAGVSTITFNLSLALAFDLVEKRILLVDINISNPSLHSAFGYPVNPGLLDYLFGIRPLDEIIRTSDYPNLDLIPCGSIDYLAITPFDKTVFSYFLDEVRKQYDFVLMDAAPILKSTQTSAISSKADGVIIVVEANRTRWEVMTDLKQRLESDGANLLGSFLNKRKLLIPNWLYRYI